MNNFNFQHLIGLANLSQFGLVFKLLFLIIELFAVIFLIVVVKQIFSMDHIIHDSNDSMFIKTVAFLLLFAAVSLFLISLAIL